MTSDNGVPANAVETRGDSPAALEAWVKPEIVSFVPASEAQSTFIVGGLDGVSNTS